MNNSTTHPPPGTWNARNLLTVHEVAEWARVHPKTVYRWIKEEKLEAIQFGPRTFRIPEDAIRKFLLEAGYDKVPSAPKPNGREYTLAFARLLTRQEQRRNLERNSGLQRRRLPV